MHGHSSPLAPPPAFEPAAAAQMERIVDDLGRMYRERNAALRALTRAHQDALLRLAAAAEMRDDDTGVHIVRMGFVTEALARAVGCDPGVARALRMAAPMHDIGKIGVPDSVLKKPGPLTAEERAVMNGHARKGAVILGATGVPLFELAAQVAQTHHERWDGTGYPSKLAGEAIPLAGRIVAVVDCFDALTMDRCYRPAMSDEQALDLMAQQRGRAFDPRIIDTFLQQAGHFIALRNRVNDSQAGLQALVADDTPGGVGEVGDHPLQALLSGRNSDSPEKRQEIDGLLDGAALAPIAGSGVS